MTLPVSLPIMLVQCHENCGWRMTAEVSGTEHQREQQGAPSPAHIEVPTLLLTCFTNAAQVHPFSQLGDDFCNNVTTGKKSQAEGTSGTFVFSFQLFTVSYETEFLMRRSQRGDLHVQGRKWTGDLVLLKVHAVDLEVHVSFLRQI